MNFVIMSQNGVAEVEESRNATVEFSSYLPLSVHGSHVHLVFALFGACLFACLVTFAVEFGVSLVEVVVSVMD